MITFCNWVFIVCKRERGGSLTERETKAICIYIYIYKIYIYVKSMQYRIQHTRQCVNLTYIKGCNYVIK